MSQHKKSQKLLFPARLQELMDRDDLTQKQLADAIGISQSAVSQYLNGTRGAPGVEEAIALAAYFGVTIDWLLGADPSVLVRPADPESETRAARDAELEQIAKILQEQALRLQNLSTAKKRSARGRRPTRP